MNDDLQDQIQQRESAESQLKELNQILKESLSKEEKKSSEAISEMEKMQEELITVCAWTKRIQDQGEWISFEEFMSRHFSLNFTHGISEDAMKEIKGQIDKARKPDGKDDSSSSASA